MPTGDSFVNLVLKRFLSQSRMNGNFLNYLQDMFYDGISRIFPAQGIFTWSYTFTNNGDGTFTIGTDPLIGTDGEGHILKLTGTSRTTNIPFEDTAATNYWVGLHYIEVPNLVQTNPRTGQVEYDLITEEIGELDNPSSVTDAGGGTIKLVVDSIFENGVDYSGREVRVWLTNPMSADTAVAFETLTVSYDGGSGENSVTTATMLGQSSVSVATADYQVAALGVSVKKSASNPWTSDPYCIIGYVEGSSSNENTDDAYDLSGGGGHTLQKAYDGFGGAGSGRNVTVNDEAIDLSQTNLTMFEHDNFHAPLRLTKDGERSIISNPNPTFDVKDLEGGVDVLQRMLAAYAYMCRVNLVDGSGNGYLIGSEPLEVPSAGSNVALTRVGVDISFPALNADLMAQHDLVEIVNSSNGNDGLYLLETIIGTNGLSLRTLDYQLANLTLETGTSMECRIYRPVMKVNTYDYRSNDQASMFLTNIDGFALDYSASGYHIPLRIVGSPGSDATTPMISIDNHLGISIFDVRYDGGISARGLLDMNGNDIDTAAGDILTGGGLIDSEGGTIQSGGGTIDTEDGNIDVGAGSLTVDTGGSVLFRNANLIELGATDVYGDLDMHGADILSCTNANCTNFKYRVAQSKILYLNPSDAIPSWDGTGGTQYWHYRGPLHSGDTGGPQSDRMEHTGVANTSFALPIHIPLGATITNFEVLIDQIGSSNIRVMLMEQDHDWTTPATNSPTGLTSNYSNAGTGVQVITTPGISVTTSVLGKGYFLRIIDITTAADSVFGAKIYYTMLELEPIG